MNIFSLIFIFSRQNNINRIDNSVDIFINKVLFRFHVWKKKLKATLHYCQVFTFVVVYVLLKKLLIVYILFFIIYLEEDFFLKDLVIHIQI